MFKSLKTVFNEKTENINLCFKIYNESNRFSDKRTEAGINEHTVLIVTDMTEFENKYKFINTGLKVNGQTIWQINIDGLLVFGAKDTNIQEIAQALNGSKIIDKKIKEILQLNKKVRLDIDSVIVDEQSEDMFFYGRTAVINTDQYAKTAVKILDSISVMYAQKTIISLANVSNNDL
ncbi:MAG: hypothetical protein BWY27_00578 [Bacteroidetes bacterium ADurb.Bin234]|nr:MAG: hypothetical protein BWY27_00578 [Bacteroidetes bacterium ADurb.Bin234]